MIDHPKIARRLFVATRQLAQDAMRDGAEPSDAYSAVIVALARTAGHWLGACRETGIVRSDALNEEAIKVAQRALRQTAVQNADELVDSASFDFRRMLSDEMR